MFRNNSRTFIFSLGVGGTIGYKIIMENLVIKKQPHLLLHQNHLMMAIVFLDITNLENDASYFL